jgi:hypothetical protein
MMNGFVGIEKSFKNIQFGKSFFKKGENEIMILEPCMWIIKLAVVLVGN